MLSPSIAALVFVAAPSHAGTAPTDPSRAEIVPRPTAELAGCIVVAGTQDLHGQIEPHVVTSGSQSVRVGGLLTLGAYVDRLREAYGDKLILLDGGDLYQGTMASNFSLGEAVITGYNLIGYTATAVGNHEFDYGPLHANDADRLGVLKARSKQSAFPWLALNVFDKATHTPVQWPNTKESHLLDVGGVRVGLIGLTTPDTPKVTRPQNVVDLEFREPVALLVAEARKLRAAGARFVVLTSHIGGRCKDLRDPNDLSSCDSDSHLLQILQAVPAGTIDVAVGGHTHAFIAHWVNGAATIQAGARAKNISWVEACASEGGGIDKARTRIVQPVDLCLDAWESGGCKPRREDNKADPKKGEPTKTDAKKADPKKGAAPSSQSQDAALPQAAAPPPAVVQATFLGTPVEQPPRLVAALNPFLERVRVAAAQPIGADLPTPLRRDDAGKDDVLGAMVAESMRRLVDADVGVQNLGGVRADLPAGPVRFGQIYEVLPFDNAVTLLTLTGAELETFILHLVARRNGDVPYLAGVTVARQGTALELRRADGSSFDDKALYKVATNDFLSMGGEGLDVIFKKLEPSRVRYTDIDMREALVKLLRQDFPVRAAAGGSPAPAKP